MTARPLSDDCNAWLQEAWRFSSTKKLAQEAGLVLRVRPQVLREWIRMSEEDLGPAAPWNVRAVPENIRKAYVDRAQREGITVADLLTKIAVNGEGPAQPQAVDAERLLKLLQCAELLGRAELPDQVKAATRTMLGHELRGMRRVQRQVQRLALPAPR